jgi:hypothetical protein
MLEPAEVVHNTGLAGLLQVAESHGPMAGEGVLLVTSRGLVWAAERPSSRALLSAESEFVRERGNDDSQGVDQGGLSRLYKNGEHPLLQHATPRGSARLRFENMTFDAAGEAGAAVFDNDHTLGVDLETLYLNPTFKNAPFALRFGAGHVNLGSWIDFVCPTYVNVPNVVTFDAGAVDRRLRVQSCDGQTATLYDMDHPQGTPTEPFYPYP